MTPEYNSEDRTHKFIWEVMAHKMKKEDFEAIQMALIECEDDHERIDKSDVMFVEFDEDMMQPRKVPSYMREKAHTYVDWDCGLKIGLILAQYAEFYSN